MERLVREAALRGATSVRVWLTDESAAAGARAQRADLARLYDMATGFELVADNGSLYDELGQTRESVLLLEGDAIYDDRILTFLLAGNSDSVVSTPDGVAAAFVSPAGARRVARARAESGPNDRSLAALARRARLQVRGPQDLPEYVPSLRLTLRAFAVRLGEPGQVRAVENLMFRRTFKGVIDAVAKYGYYHIVRSITRVLARTALTPNLLTLSSIIGIWAAVPSFAAGLLGAGVVAAWAGVILDSVDGKLARLTLHLSDAMGALEHVTAAVGLVLWFAALGWHFTGGGLLRGGPLAMATWALIAACVLDKMVSGLFRRQFGRELFDYRPIDAVFHLVAARRNAHLLLLSLGVLAGRAELAFVGMAAWMVITLVFHLVRWSWATLAREADAVAGPD